MAKWVVALLFLLIVVAASADESDFDTIYKGLEADPNTDWDTEPTIFQAAHAAGQAIKPPTAPIPADTTRWANPSLSVYDFCQQLLGRKE